jgi:hypothetical protein
MTPGGWGNFDTRRKIWNFSRGPKDDIIYKLERFLSQKTYVSQNYVSHSCEVSLKSDQ